DIDTRFEVAKRDAEIAWLRAQKQTKYASTEDDLSQRILEIEADRDFLRFCNLGAEAMQAEHIERVKRIASKYTWQAPDGKRHNILSDSEVESLSVRTGTLTAAERQIINHHIDITIQMLEALPWPRHLEH